MCVALDITIYRVYSKGKRIVSYAGGKSVHWCDMTCVCVCMCVCW